MTKQLQGRELDAALSRAMGWQIEWRDVYYLRAHDEYLFDIAGIDADSVERQPVLLGAVEQVAPFYSHDLNAMHEVEAKIDRRGLRSAYARALLVSMGIDDKLHVERDALEAEPPFFGFDCVWYPAHATAEQKAHAALMALTQ